MSRGGEKIEIEEEEEFFTVYLKDKKELEKVKHVSGIDDVKSVQPQIFKVHVSKEKRDEVMDFLRSKEMNCVCHHAYKTKDSTNTRYYLTDKIIVKFALQTPKNTIESIFSNEGVRVIKEYRDEPNCFLVQVTSRARKNPIKVANLLDRYENVKYAEPNLINRYELFYIPSDSYFQYQWHLKAWDAPYMVEDADVSATEAWDIEKGKRSVVVAILDDGFDLSHPDFNGNGKIVHAKDFVDGDSNPFPVTSEEDYHGTPVAGVAIAEENGQGVVGVAPECSFMPIRFPLNRDDDFEAESFDYVGKFADVISCSWGPPPANAPLHQRLYDKLHTLATTGGPRKKGCVIVFAAGNYNAPLNDPNNNVFKWYHPRLGIVERHGPILNGYAVHPDVITVSASTSLNKKAAYSNWGKEISVCAPSNNFHPLYDQNVEIQGYSIWTTDNEIYGTDFTSGSRFTGHFGGTSSATPLVAGIAALILSANPSLTAGDVKDILQDTADKILDSDPDVVLGLKKGNYDDDGHSEWFGYGKINAAKAVTKAKELQSQKTDVVTTLNLDSVDDGSLIGKGDSKIFKVSVGNKLRVILEGPNDGDFDIYLKRGSVPTIDNYDARGYTPSSNENIQVDVNEVGEYYVMVHSHQGAGDFKIKFESEYKS